MSKVSELKDLVQWLAFGTSLVEGSLTPGAPWSVDPGETNRWFAHAAYGFDGDEFEELPECPHPELLRSLMPAEPDSWE